jgi:hypothetical protein
MLASISRAAAIATLVGLGACAQLPPAVVVDASDLYGTPRYDLDSVAPPESDSVVATELPGYQPRPAVLPRPIYRPTPVLVPVPVYVPRPVIVPAPVPAPVIVRPPVIVQPPVVGYPGGGGNWTPVVQ